MITAGNIKTADEFRAMVQRVAEPYIHPDIPQQIGMSPRQMYAEFCYRMCKFDLEFAHLDPAVASSWLNLGLTRLISEMAKRMFKDANDISVARFFEGYVETESLTKNAKGSIPGEIYVFTINKDHVYSTEPLVIWMRYPLYFVFGPESPWKTADDTPFPKHIPYEDTYDDKVSGRRRGAEFKVSYRELSDVEYKNQNFYVSNSFSSAGMYPPKVYVHWHVGRDVEVLLGNRWIARGVAAADPRYEPVNEFNAGWEVTKVNHDSYQVGPLIKDTFLDLLKDKKNTIVKTPPAEFHHDIVDYAIDAYFEGSFFQSFGKYSLQQARQDVDTKANIAGTRQHKLDAVPPQRYKLASGPGAPPQGGH